MTSQVPKWLMFFKAAGIPASVASNYAVAFCDHRIQDDMLADLNKEILRDIGVTVMGDIIAILRHAKQVHAQTEREKAAKALAMLEEQDTTSESETPTKNLTAASRMVDHWINNQRMSSGTRSPVSGTESPVRTLGKKRLTPKSRTLEHEPKPKTPNLSDRFTVKTIQQANMAMKKKTSPKVQKVSVRLPNTGKKVSVKAKQTTAAQQKQTVATTSVTKTKPDKKKSVFDRLGEEQHTVSKPEIHPPTLKPLKTNTSVKTIKTKEPSTPKSPPFPTSVFSRLGNVSPIATTQPTVTVQAVLPSKRPSNLGSLISDDDDNSDDGIDYTTHSVLRPPRTKQTVKVKPVKPVKPVKRTVGVVSKDVSNSKSVFARLGPLTPE